MAHAGARADVARISISHPERVLFAGAGTTKLGLARYYESIADWILPHLVDRPLTLVRCPAGVPASGARKGVDCIFMKHAKVWGPAPIRRVRIREKTKTGEDLIVDTVPALIGLVQMDSSRFTHGTRGSRAWSNRIASSSTSIPVSAPAGRWSSTRRSSSGGCSLRSTSTPS